MEAARQQIEHLESDLRNANDEIKRLEGEHQVADGSPAEVGWSSGKKDELACELAAALGEWADAADDTKKSIANDRVMAARAALDTDGAPATAVAAAALIADPWFNTGGSWFKGSAAALPDPPEHPDNPGPWFRGADGSWDTATSPGADGPWFRADNGGWFKGELAVPPAQPEQPAAEVAAGPWFRGQPGLFVPSDSPKKKTKFEDMLREPPQFDELVRWLSSVGLQDWQHQFVDVLRIGRKEELKYLEVTHLETIGMPDDWQTYFEQCVEQL